MPSTSIHQECIDCQAKPYKTAQCPECGSTCKRHSIRTRRIKDISLDGERVITVPVGVYRCLNEACSVKFFRVQPPSAVKGKHYSRRAIERALAAIGQDKTTFCGTTGRLERDFNIKPTKSTLWEWFHSNADQIDLLKEYEAWAAKGFSGVLAIDELYDEFVVFVATDPLNDRTVSVRLCESASGEELRAFLQHLKGLGIEPEVIVSDGSPLYGTIPFEVWPNAKHQMCLFHFIRPFTKAVLNAVAVYRRQLAKKPEHRPASRLLWENRYIFTTRREHLSPEKHRILQDLTQRYLRLYTIRRFMDEVFALFADTRERAIKQRDRIVKKKSYQGLPGLGGVLKSLTGPTFEKALTFLAYHNCPKTTNHVERSNRFYRKRAKTHYRNRTRRSIWNMIKVDLMNRKACYTGNGHAKLIP